ncbi:MAG: Lrp/AsnC family transcriptional regulator [Candidatus Thorarchaeota archaeon]|nr:MAG: Lrp/AsnC family transcriptional regulator [Candidatus Thorarchaeota archaeon]RLI56618.1 MAG: Lrp/AsnC family transcriptional regulator [Candidatus Thorarchaeota archaeon]
MTERVMAYVLMDLEIGKTDEVLEQLRLIEEATVIAVTTGAYDIILRLEVPDLEALYDITVHKIHAIPGIKETSTAVIEKMYSV